MERFVIQLPRSGPRLPARGARPLRATTCEAVGWAQDYARKNRELMMAPRASRRCESGAAAQFAADGEAVNCHHNYVAREHHFGKDVLVTRKGAVRARRGELGIIPG